MSQLEFQRLRLGGFKSFADTTEILIEPGLTGIVGPNGCGKSNIVEALRWVMGESAAGSLRGGEMDDIVFGGAIGRQPHDLAEVVLRVRGRVTALPERTERPSQGSEDLDISRRLVRGSGSTYRVNGREARARDVQTIFADAASGSRSAAFIGQGQVGALVDARADERRRLLEEAAGISGLHGRRREAEGRLQAALANMAQVGDRLVAKRERLTALEKEARQAERYRKLGQELREGEALLLLARWQAAESDHARLLGECRELRTTLDNARWDAASARAAQERAKAHLDRLHAAERETGALAATATARLDALRAAADREAQAAAEAASHAAVVAVEWERAERTVASRTAELRAREGAQAERLAQLDGTRGRAGEAAAARHEAAAQLDVAEGALRSALGDAATARAALDESRRVRDASAARLTDLRAAAEAVASQRAGQAAVAGDDGIADLARRSEQASADLVASVAEEESTGVALRSARDDLASAESELRECESTGNEAAAALATMVEQRRRHEEASARQSGRIAALERRRAAHEQRAAAHRGALAQTDPAAAEEERAVLEERQAEASARLTTARADHASAQMRSSDAAGHRQNVAADLARLDAEIDALAAVLPETSGASVADDVEVGPGDAGALAAALGDDLLAGTDPATEAHWRLVRAAGETDPSLPAVCVPLSSLVKAPDVLARRLAQVGVVDGASAPALVAELRVGQRLVSRDGGLWRWDGFVRRPGAEAPAARRLRQATRLRACRQEHGDLAAVLVAATAAGEAATAQVQGLTTAVTEAEALASVVAGELAAANRDLEVLRARVAMLAREGAGLAGEAADLAAEERELLAGHDGVAAPDAVAERAATARHEAARRALDAARTTATAAFALVQAHERSWGEARSAENRARAGLDAARSALEATRIGLASAREERAVLAARLDADAARLAVEIDALAAVSVASEADWLARDAGCRDLDAARLAAEEEAVSARADREASAALAAETAAGLQRLELWLEMAAADVARLTDETEADRERLAAAAIRRRDADRARDERQAAAEAASASFVALETASADLVDGARLATEARLAAESAHAGTDAAGREADARAAELRERLAALTARIEVAGAALGELAHECAQRLGRAPDEACAEDGVARALEVATIAVLEERLVRLRVTRDRLGAVNLRAETEAAELRDEVVALETDEAELREAAERLQGAVSTLNREARSRLLAAFAQIEVHFTRLFTQLFGGGTARLVLTNIEDPLAAGLELEACPPGKKLQHMSLLSGGEKALTAVALVFAFFLAQPSPLCVLDEVDAPLDDANVDRLLGLMREIANETSTRFLVVTHHPLTMARMDRLYGVTMIERGLSKLVSVDFAEAVEMRATA